MLRTAIAGFVGVLVGAAVVGIGTGQREQEEEQAASGLYEIAARAGGASFYLHEEMARARYPWLPEKLREPYIPCWGEWQALSLDARESFGGYDYLITEEWSIYLSRQGLSALVNCGYQPAEASAWERASDRVKRGEFLTMGASLFEGIEASVPGVPQERVILGFHIRGGDCAAVWHDGKVYLRAEPGFSERAEPGGKFFEQMEQ